MARLPQTPPPLPDDPAALRELFSKALSADVPDAYLHWDELRFRQPPEGMTVTEWWHICRLRRGMQQRPLPLRGTDGTPFDFQVPPRLQEALFHITMEGGLSVIPPESATNTVEKERHRTRQLIEEAISSSLIEGAVTTRVEAQRLLHTKRTPKDQSERMIVNNYRAMRRLQELKKKPLTPGHVFELHRMLTEGTLGNLEEAGRFRQDTEPIIVGDKFDPTIVYHRPPPAMELPARLEALCAFANGQTPDYFLHPIIRSILLHFWLAYDHPFTDGNGRTARALFYWSMLRQGFWIVEFISISRIIHQSRKAYYQAFLFTETDENDTTYFLINQAEVLEKAVENLRDYMAKRAKRLQEIDSQLHEYPGLNLRQKALLQHALSHSGYRYTIAEHQQKCGVVYATARADLLDLAARGLLIQSKEGKALAFRPVADLAGRVAVQ